MSADASAEPWHARDSAEALGALGVDPHAGLTEADAVARRGRFGPNALPEPPVRSLWSVVLRQFASPLIYLLLFAGGLAAVLGHISDAVVILVVVLLNAALGAFQEGRAERSLSALRKLASLHARVVREGQERVVEARELVPGDVVLLAAGDAVPADARLLEAAALQVAEAALTGESLPVPKDVPAVAPAAALAERHDMVHAGTHVTAGRARALVVATGMSTEVGRIAQLAEGAPASRTPLERRIDGFGRLVMIAAAGLFVLVNAVGLLRGIPFAEIAMIAISQVVGLVPEGLPIAITIALATGVQRMARRGALVRRLAAVETLGCTTVICTDKTGTLTRNELTVTALKLPARELIEVSGSGYEPVGELRAGGKALSPDDWPELRALLEAGALCNDAQLLGPDAHHADYRAIGDPTEAALLALAIKAGLVPSVLADAQPRRAELPFDSSTKMMATQHRVGDADRVLLKGAPESVLALCSQARDGAASVPLDDASRARLQRDVDVLAARALRVLAIAEVSDGRVHGEQGFAAFAGRATLLGLVGQMDPPRLEAAAAVATCIRAGIRPVMVTGDHAATALAVARQLGIAAEDAAALDGAALRELSPEQLTDAVARTNVFARVHPAQKLDIVEALRGRGEVVAMTGDGVNDAPALVRADVGVAMGKSGTDVAKESAEIVITDDDFATIVAAVEQGRLVYGNIRKILVLFLATSLAEVSVLLAAVLLGYPPPFAAVQILWNNLVTEGLITVNLAMEPLEGDEMKRRPVDPAAPLITRAMALRIALMSAAIVTSTLGWFLFRLHTGVPFAVAQTETFTLLAICEWFNVLSCRSEHVSALRSNPLRNRYLVVGLLVANVLQFGVVFLPGLGGVFHTVPIALGPALAIGAVGSLVLWVDELRKLALRRRLVSEPTDNSRSSSPASAASAAGSTARAPGSRRRSDGG